MVESLETIRWGLIGGGGQDALLLPARTKSISPSPLAGAAGTTLRRAALRRRICELGESCSTCCGDLVCEGPEDGFNCLLDCGAPPVCGDQVCDPGEDLCSCADCGTPPSTEAGSCTDGVDNDCVSA